LYLALLLYWAFVATLLSTFRLLLNNGVAIYPDTELTNNPIQLQCGIIFWLQNLPNDLAMPSSVVAAIRYDANANTLRVVYVSGSVYDYKNVPAKVFKEMKTASSKGEFLNKHIKPNYEFEKIR